VIITRTPLRITLGGGGTDLPSYYEKSGGLVISMAIDKYVYITLKPDHFDKLCKLRYSEIEITDNPKNLKNTRAREALLLHNLNAIEISTCADLSSNSGLGSSGSFLVGLLKAIREYQRIDTSPAIIAEEACHIEIDKLQEPVGKQDQYIASYGGIKIFSIATNGKVATKELTMDNALINNMHVYSLNVKRNASDVLQDQQKLNGNTKAILDIIKDYGYKTIDLLENSEFDEYGLLLDSYWSLKKKLSTKISLDIADKIYEEVKNNYNVLGGKIIGAGGGGFLMLYINKNHNKLEQYMKSIGMLRLQYAVDHTGSRVIGNYLL